MPRASAPPSADAQSSGKTLNMPNTNAAPHASRRSAKVAVRAERLVVGVLALVINCAIQAEKISVASTGSVQTLGAVYPPSSDNLTLPV